MKIKHSFSAQLMKIFLISTLLPFILISTFLAQFYSREYEKDIQSLLNSTASSMTSNMITYLEELEQVTLQPYYSDSLYNYLEKKVQGYEYDILEEIPLKSNLESNFRFVRYTRADVNGIFIMNDDDCLYYTVDDYDHKSLIQPVKYGEKDWYQRAIAADGRCLLLGPHVSDYIEPNDSSVISLVRSIVKIENRRPLYVIKIDINISILDRIFKELSFHVPSKIILTDENQNIVYTNALLSQADTDSFMKNFGKSYVNLEDGSYQAYSYPLGKYPWNITVLLSDKHLRSRILIIYSAAFCFYIVGVLISTSSHYMFSKKLVASINQMKEVFWAIQHKDFSKKYENVSGTELDDLGKLLNQTSEQLNKTLQREYIMALKQKDSEFKALQAQIQPHFLFNTLNNLIALNQMGERERLEDSLYEMSEMLRYILKAPSLIPLATELQFLKYYCALQKLRFNDRLSFDIFPETGDEEMIMIPKLLLQPIVENSVLHGIEPCEYPCYIRVLIQKTEDYLIMSVCDNGIGFDTEILSENSIGLNNVRERLKSFSPRGRMEIQSSFGKGTKTTIMIFREDMEETL